MPWNSQSPEGNKSVSVNRPKMQENTTYIETTMGNQAIGTNPTPNTLRDHFWKIGSDEDGRHRFIQSPAFTTGSPGVPAEANLGSGMDSVLYSKLLTVAESSAQQDVQYFLKNKLSGSLLPNPNIMQMLGMRACCVFDVLLPAPNTVTIKFNHNITSIVRNSEGVFTATFANQLPSDNYLVLGLAIRNNASADRELIFEMRSGTTVSSVKSQTTMKFMTRSDGGDPHDPLQAWFVCFGG